VPRAIHRRAPPFLDVVTTLSTPLAQSGKTRKPAWEGIAGSPQGPPPHDRVDLEWAKLWEYTTHIGRYMPTHKTTPNGR